MKKYLCSPIKKKILVNFYCSLPCWWLCLYGIQNGLLRSKDPQWLELYSSKKLIFLICTALVCLFWIKIVIPHLCNFILRKFEHLRMPNPFLLFLILAITTSLIRLENGVIVGEDVTGQVLSSLQYFQGKSSFANYCSFPNQLDLSQDLSSWSPRPPGASWIALPGLIIGLSIGDSLKLTLFLLFTAGGFGWLRLSRRFGLCDNSLHLLALLLGLGVGSSIAFFSTMNCALYGLVPWMIIWGMNISCEMNKRDPPLILLIFNLLGFSVCLGCFCVAKLSGMIAALTIFFIPLFFLFYSIKKNSNFFLKLFLCFTFFLIVLAPYKVLEDLNERLRGQSADKMYRKIDYNKQSSLWGDYFVESTKGFMLGWSTLGAPGYALPSNILAHGVRDLSNQFFFIQKWMKEKKVNPHALICGTVGMFFTFLLSFNLWGLKNEMTHEFKLVSCMFLTIPFVGLSAVSYLHGFNYSLYSSHTLEYALLLTLPVGFAMFQSRNTKNLTVILLSGICFALPISLQAERILRLPFEENKFRASSTEKDRGFAARDFSNAIQIIEKDSKNESDVLLFLPSGDLGDLYLRTRLRTLGLHFSGDNLKKTKAFRTSQPLIVYCAYSASLNLNPEFRTALKENFPQTLSSSEISAKNEENVIVLKIFLDPDSPKNG